RVAGDGGGGGTRQRRRGRPSGRIRGWAAEPTWHPEANRVRSEGILQLLLRPDPPPALELVAQETAGWALRCARYLRRDRAAARPDADSLRGSLRDAGLRADGGSEGHPVLSDWLPDLRLGAGPVIEAGCGHGGRCGAQRPRNHAREDQNR